MELGLWAFDASEFLLLYGALFVSASVLSLWIPGWIRPEGRDSAADDRYAYAAMAGGKRRYFQTVLAQLLSQGAVDFDSTKKALIVRSGGSAADLAERAILGQAGRISWKDVTKSLADDWEHVQNRLVSSGLMQSGSDIWQLRLFQSMPLLLLLIFGGIRWQAGKALGESVEYLTLLLTATILALCLRFALVNRLTQGGLAALRRKQRGSTRLRRAPTNGEMGMAVALFGTAVLAGTPYHALHAMHVQRGDAGGCGTSGGSDGGCGGGGCGGCGG